MTPTRLLTGWGRTAATAADVRSPTTAAGIVESLRDAPGRGVIARGLGRSYGDQAQNAGGRVVECTGAVDVVSADLAGGVVVASGGVSIDRLLRDLVPRGWFVPVTPGTRYVTVAGAIASDIHGKDHHRVGSFGNFVDSVTLLVPSGERLVVGPQRDADLFWATVGGMGLTGVILEATIRMVPIASSSLVVDTERASDLDDCMDRMTSGDDRYRYAAAWIDCLARGGALGRSVLYRGDFAAVDQLPPRRRTDPLRFRAGPRIPAPPQLPVGLLNRGTIAAFNEAWYRRAPRDRRGEIQDITAFFHPLDAVDGWNRLYGPRGFLQYQFVVPFGAETTLRRIVERLAGSRCASFLGVLKRFGPGTPGLLSFPMAGWTLALDMPAGAPHLAETLDEIDRMVVEAGGRVYLAKDSRMRPDLLEAMYPGVASFRRIRSTLDPDQTLRSDLSRRLGL